MSRVAVEYLVPVLCWVDTEEGTITSVTEHIELIEPTGKLFDNDGERVFLSGKEIAAVTQIADDNDWPAWERGY